MSDAAGLDRVTLPKLHGLMIKESPDVITVEDEYYIRARSSLADARRTLSLMRQDMFAVFDRNGDFQPIGFGELGLFYRESRHLSCWRLRLRDHRLLLLSSTVREDNNVLGVDLTNPDIQLPEGGLIRHGTIHFYRSCFLWQNSCQESIRVRNYGLDKVELELVMEFAADFADIFEVRGTARERRGESLPAAIGLDSLTLGYRGLDGVVRQTQVSVPVPCGLITPCQMQIPLLLEPGEEREVAVSVHCLRSDESVLQRDYRTAQKELAAEVEARPACPVAASNEAFNNWLGRSWSDLLMMVAQTEDGPYLYAGIPWYNTVFGRDGLITSLQLLWLEPQIARGVLAYLSRHQAEKVSRRQDAEPGKILHEKRSGEMAVLREVPFGSYYGSVDSTLLYLIVAGAYLKQTGDLDFLRSIEQNLFRAGDWIDLYGDRDGDGFVEYGSGSSPGLVHQGWKDSFNSVFHSDGTLAEGPIALCEVQAYTYAAKHALAEIARALKKPDWANRLETSAKALRDRFGQAFWDPDLGMFVLALDREKRPCRVRSSNAGQCLFSGIASEEQTEKVLRELRRPAFFSGWGVRTIAEGESRYNPMSYHNGSIWPHDNALIAWGLTRHRNKELALEILNGLFEAATFVDLSRLPELFCGFERRRGKAPTEYPVACSPQAWAAGSVFMLMQACLGLTVRAAESRIYFYYPALPPPLERISLRNVPVGAARIDLDIVRQDHTVAIEPKRQSGPVQIVLVA
jgi:glycogen debranching enzyme